MSNSNVVKLKLKGSEFKADCAQCSVGKVFIIPKKDIVHCFCCGYQNDIKGYLIDTIETINIFKL